MENDNGRKRVVLAPRIVADPEIKSGKPVIEGTRVPVELILGQLAGGMSIEAVMDEYVLSREDVRAALSYAAQPIGEERIWATG